MSWYSLLFYFSIVSCNICDTDTYMYISCDKCTVCTCTYHNMIQYVHVHVPVCCVSVIGTCLGNSCGFLGSYFSSNSLATLYGSFSITSSN